MASFKMNSISVSNLLDDMPREPRGTYKGSNEFILVDDNDSRINVKQGLNWMKGKWRNVSRKKFLRKRVPIMEWLPSYSWHDAIGDMVAGVTVGLTVIPQALAYAGIAGLDPAFGLYSSFMGCFVYIFFGSCKYVPMGPTAIASLLTFQATHGVWQKAVLLGFLTGIIELLMGLFGFGFLVDFVSGPVSSGFTSAICLIILTSQVKDIFGIRASGMTFTEMWNSILHNIKNAQFGDTMLGLGCIVLILLMKLLVNFGSSNVDGKTKTKLIFEKICWFIGTSRNAIVVILSGIMAAYFYEDNSSNYFQLIGDIPKGLPEFGLPPFSAPLSRNASSNYEDEESFVEIVREMGSSLIVIPLISLLEDISVCKAFAQGQNVDATQELIALGMSNIFNSFAMGYPITGAISRGAVNQASGIRTPFGNFYTGALVVLALLFLTPLFAYIPKAALAAIIISAVVFMIEVRVIKPLWRSKRSDLVPGLSTFIVCLVFPIQWGILVGIVLNIVFILYHAARPKIRVEHLVTNSDVKFLMITPDRCLIFPSADYVCNLINKQGLKSKTAVVVDCSYVYGSDFTTATVIHTLIKDFEKRQQLLIFYNLKPAIGQIFEEAGTQIRVFYGYNELQEALG